MNFGKMAALNTNAAVSKTDGIWSMRDAWGDRIYTPVHIPLWRKLRDAIAVSSIAIRDGLNPTMCICPSCGHRVNAHTSFVVTANYNRLRALRVYCLCAIIYRFKTTNPKHPRTYAYIRWDNIPPALHNGGNTQAGIEMITGWWVEEFFK